MLPRPPTPAVSRLFPLLLGCLVLPLACATSGERRGEAVATTSAALGEDQQSGASVFVLDSGHWVDGGEDGASLQSFWSDLSVSNLAYVKDVGIRWTSDGWTTTHDSKAHYEGALGGGRERWGVQVQDFGTSAPWEAPLEVEYAAYATMNGVTSWSPFRNHYIYHPVSPSQPVRLLASSVSEGGDGKPVLHGTARALNVTGARHVWIRYSVNGWSTWSEAEAPFDGTDFPFTIPLAVSPATTETVTFALRLEADGTSAWDNQGGANYTQRLAPALGSQAIGNDLGRAADGIRLFSGSVTTGLPVDQVWVHVDGGPRIALGAAASTEASAVGFSPSGSFYYPFASSGLAAGAHSVSVEAAAGAFVRSFAPVAFEVAHGIGFESSWQLVAPGQQPDAWDFARDASGRIVVGGSAGIRAYAQFGDAAAATTFAASPNPAYIADVAVDAKDRVYGLGGSSLTRWLPSGALDVSFGASSVLDFSTGTYGTSAVCYPANLEIVGADLYIVDSCNARVLRLTLDGAFVDEVDLGSSAAYANVTRTSPDGDDVWVGLLSGSALQTSLVHLATRGQPLHVVESRPVDSGIANLDAFVISPDGSWVTDFSANLWHLTASGSTNALWLAGDASIALDGSLGIAKRIERLASGEINVLSVSGGRIETFAAK